MFVERRCFFVSVFLSFYVCCSKKVVLRARTTAPLKICPRRQLFVHIETRRSHLAWSTDDTNLIDFFGYQNKLVSILSQLRPGPLIREGCL